MWTALLLLAASPSNVELATPFIVKAAGKPIKLDVGHAAPIFADFDGDHLPDLLVGQFGQGRLRIYKNVGTKEEPKFEKFEWFQAGGKPAEVEAG
jgi:hypothetical protein